MNDYISVEKQLPRKGVIVNTAIIDEKGIRNLTKLKLENNLWFVPDGSMYVYYTPTHWKP